MNTEIEKYYVTIIGFNGIESYFSAFHIFDEGEFKAFAQCIKIFNDIRNDIIFDLLEKDPSITFSIALMERLIEDTEKYSEDERNCIKIFIKYSPYNIYRNITEIVDIDMISYEKHTLSIESSEIIYKK